MMRIVPAVAASALETIGNTPVVRGASSRRAGPPCM
jgi:hypothetical protein